MRRKANQKREREDHGPMESGRESERPSTRKKQTSRQEGNVELGKDRGGEITRLLRFASIGLSLRSAFVCCSTVLAR